MSPATDPTRDVRQTPREGDRRTPEVTLSATLQLLTQAEGGPSRPVRSGARLLARFGLDDLAQMRGVQIAFDAPSAPPPGLAVQVQLSTWADEEFNAPPGTPLRVYQGLQLVGVGTIESRRCSSISR